jgi:hypothetical protein
MKWVFSGRKDNNYNSGRIHAGFFFWKKKTRFWVKKTPQAIFKFNSTFVLKMLADGVRGLSVYGLTSTHFLQV